jgi:hypothetical protein
VYLPFEQPNGRADAPMYVGLGRIHRCAEYTTTGSRGSSPRSTSTRSPAGGPEDARSSTADRARCLPPTFGPPKASATNTDTRWWSGTATPGAARSSAGPARSRLGLRGSTTKGCTRLPASERGSGARSCRPTCAARRSHGGPLPLLYLRGLSCGDFAPALEEFFATEAGLSPATVARLTEQWRGEREELMGRDLSEKESTSTCGWTGSTRG